MQELPLVKETQSLFSNKSPTPSKASLERENKEKKSAKWWGRMFVLILIFLFGLLYFTYVILVWGPRAEENYMVETTKITLIDKGSPRFLSENSTTSSNSSVSSNTTTTSNSTTNATTSTKKEAETAVIRPNKGKVIGGNPGLALNLIIIFNILFLMMIWSFIMSACTNPGKVPAYWGYNQGDSDIVKRKYCKMCNAFKPERCHHCSACNRCVLNMDHHCLWINNCVGFYNRKYFILLLIYVEIMMLYVFASLGNDFYLAMQWGFKQDNDVQKDDPDFIKNWCIIISFFICIFIWILITFFIQFHWRLASENKTTIEKLDHDTLNFMSKYDVGKSNNWKQVFGSNKWVYPFPMFCGSNPHGDGLTWPKNPEMIEMNRLAAQKKQDEFAVPNRPTKADFYLQREQQLRDDISQSVGQSQQLTKKKSMASEFMMKKEKSDINVDSPLKLKDGRYNKSPIKKQSRGGHSDISNDQPRKHQISQSPSKINRELNRQTMTYQTPQVNFTQSIVSNETAQFSQQQTQKTEMNTPLHGRQEKPPRPKSRVKSNKSNNLK